jgi:hypothetical protein
MLQQTSSRVLDNEKFGPIHASATRSKVKRLGSAVNHEMVFCCCVSPHLTNLAEKLSISFDLSAVVTKKISGCASFASVEPQRFYDYLVK